MSQEITVTFDSEITDRIRMRKVELVPAMAAYREQLDDNAYSQNRASARTF